MTSSSTTYTCPMHPEVRQETPGTCPKCEMQLVPADEKHRHEGMPKHGQMSEGNHLEMGCGPILQLSASAFG